MRMQGNGIRIKEGGTDTVCSEDECSLPLSFNTVLYAGTGITTKAD